MTQTPKSSSHLIIYKDAATLASKAAEQFAGLARDAAAKRGRFAVALSGGSTPRAMFSLLAEQPLRGEVPWESTFVFWSDERTVPPDDPDSNYRMAYESLISRVPLPAGNVHRMRGEEEPTLAADEYQAELAAFFGPGAPRFDLVMLGMGDDGHTASLFPGTAAVGVRDRQVVSNYVPRLNTYRITMTVPAINAAAAVSFLVSGTSKAARLKEVLQGEHGNELPSQLIKPVDGTLFWMTDRDAAADLSLQDKVAQPDAEVLEVSL
jgi:6-phosphogluconolactonase